MKLPTRIRVDLAQAASVALLAALALVTRASLRAQVFQGGEVTPVEVDAYLHLRRALRTVETFPTLTLREPLVDWPRGAVYPWSEGFDWCLAALARLAGCSTAACAGPLVAWSPVLLGVGVTLGTYAVCRRFLHDADGATGCSLLAGLVTALAPQSVATSVVGRVDHHVVEQATVLALLAWCLARPPPDATRAQALRFELTGAAVLALSLWCFNGSVLYAAAAAGVLGLRALSEVGRTGRAGLGGLAWFPAALFVAWRAAPAVHAHGRAFDHLFTSYLQPALLAVAGGLVLAAGEVARLDRWGAAWPLPRRLAARIGVMAFVTAAALGLLVLAVPALHVEVAAGGRRWLAREDGYMAGIEEVRPLFPRASPREGLATVYRTLGVAGFAHPLALVAAVWGMVRYRRRGALELGVFWVALALLTVAQMRFGRVLAPVAGVALGVGAWAVSERLRELSHARRAATAVPWVLAALWLLDPRARVWFRARPAAVNDVVRAARFLRGVARPGEGVFTSWPDGNIVAVKAERPVLVTSFGSYLAPDTFWQAERAWLGSEDTLDEFLDGRSVRWIVAGAEHFGGGAVDATLSSPLARDARGHGGFDVGFFRRVPLAGLVIGGSGAPRAGVAQLRGWMPRYSVGVAWRSRDHVVPALWVYERVGGATVRGAGPDGALVTLTTRLLVDGVPSRHVAWSRVVGGAFAVRTALPTRWRSANLATPDAALLAVGEGAPRPVEVPEAAVRAGVGLPVE